MKTWIFIIYLLTFCSSVSSAKPFSMTHIVYPDIEDYVDLLVEIYTELGFKVELIPVPSLRGLILLNDGVVDSDLIRLNSVAKKFPNVIVVQPELQQVSLSLICAKEVPCNRSVLTDKNISILANGRMFSLLDVGELKASQIEIELFSSVFSMIKAKRYLYAIYVVDELIKKQFDQDFQIIEIEQLSVNHIIHKKHVGLLPQIQEKIRARLPEFNRKRLEKKNAS